MPDWNHDGKQDWHDDYAINELIPSEKSSKGSSSDGGCGCFVFAGLIVLMLIFGK